MSKRTWTTVAAVGLLGCCGAGIIRDWTTPDDPPVPAYTVSHRPRPGGWATIAVVERATTNAELERVFDNVMRRNRADGGHWVAIDCATGNTPTYAHRLANGRYAIGRKGAAATGLHHGGHDFDPIADWHCP